MRVRRRVLAALGAAAVATTALAVVAGATPGGGNRDSGTGQAGVTGEDRAELVLGTAAPTAPTPRSTLCSVSYTVTSGGGGRFVAGLIVDTTRRIDNWRLTWTYPGGQQIRQVTGGAFKQNGAAVRVRSLDGKPLRPGRSLQLRVIGTSGSSKPGPTAFAVNGVSCTMRSAPTPATTPVTPTTKPVTTTPPTTSPTTTTPPTTPTTKPVTTTTKPATTTTKPVTTTTNPPSSNPPSSNPPSSNPPSGQVLGTGRIQFGRTYSGDGTFYGATGGGNCMFDAGGSLMVAAMNQADYENSQACGAFVEVTGPKGTVSVKIVDRCPECRPGDIDLSQQAFAAIADPIAGRVRITWRLQSPALTGPIAYRYKEGSSQWWCGIQIRNHRNPVRSVEALVGGAWKQIPRQEYNYFVSADGTGCGGSLRVTDIYGNQVTDAKVPVVVGAVQPGSGQFGPPR